MKKNLFSIIAIVVALASIAVATAVVAKKTAAKRARVARKSLPSQGAPRSRATRSKRNTNGQTGPLRSQDPNRAPQNLVDDALYTNEEFFGAQASVARPYSVAFERLATLLSKYPKDARLHLHAARLAEKLGQFDRAAAEMSEYADLRGRSADSLRRLAAFYHHRAKWADEVRTLQELARTLTVNEGAPIYKRAAELVRTRSLKE